MEPAILKIDLGALRFNYQLFVATSHGEAGAVLKADAYGMGMSRIAAELVEVGCKHFFVTTCQEAIDLRNSVGANVVIYALSGPLSSDDCRLLSENNIVAVINSMDQVELWTQNSDVTASLHVDTGMHRLGLSVEEIKDPRLDDFPVELLITHLACADEPSHWLNKKQVQRFKTAQQRFPTAKTSMGNSAGTLNGLPYQGDITRPGIGLYGGNPFVNQENPMRTVASCEAQVLALRTVKPGTPIGYGAVGIVDRKTRIATVSIGYADGLFRSLSDRGSFTFHGKRLPIVGRVSMDLVQIDATDVDELHVGDFVELFGYETSLDDFAIKAGTISYEILCRIGAGVTRRYIECDPETSSA